MSNIYIVTNDITGDIFTTQALDTTEAKLNAYAMFVAQDTQADTARMTVIVR